MTVPLHPKERPHSASVVPQGITRSRASLYDGEPLSGTILVWRVLGFGGHSNPLVYSRVASFAIRSAQALLEADPSLQLGKARCQLYVDDPAVVIAGSLQERARTFDLLLLWWQVLGIPLAWPKGSVSLEQHTWIGANFTIQSRGVCRMTLPVPFLRDLAELVRQFTKSKGSVSLKLADQLVGRAGRLAHVIPTAKPYVGMLCAALTAAKAAAANVREAPPGRVAVRRFRTAAYWLHALLRGEDSTIVPLETDVFASPSPPPSQHRLAIEFDASPWGGGAVLWREGSPVEWWSVRWDPDMVRPISSRITTGDEAWQSFWELLALALAVDAWAIPFTPLAIIGDNTGALEIAINGGGKTPPMLALSREIAWRRARRNLLLGGGHLPTEANTLADALSRLCAAHAKQLPQELANVPQRTTPDVLAFWVAARPPPL